MPNGVILFGVILFNVIKEFLFFGKIDDDNYFINREKDADKLKVNLLSGINAMLISPRRLS
jgi:hypothetical protein